MFNVSPIIELIDNTKGEKDNCGPITLYDPKKGHQWFMGGQ